MPSEKIYEIDRHQASKLLKVSTRTIDRYLRCRRLSATKQRGRVMLCKEEVLGLKKGTPYVPQPQEEISKPKINPHVRDTSFYKDLYDETLDILKEKDSRLQQMQYRIGQLESQTTTHYPIKTLNPDPAEFRTVQLLQQNLSEAEHTSHLLETKLKREKLNRSIITGILYFLLLLQPILWYILRGSF